MKRDWDTIRVLLTKLEENTVPTDMLQLSSFPPERAAEISYHMELLLEAGLVDGKMSKTLGPGPYNFFATRLTQMKGQVLPFAFLVIFFANGKTAETRISRNA